MAKKQTKPHKPGTARQAPAKVLLLHLGEDSTAGRKVRDILRELKLPAVTLNPLQAGQTVGYLAGLPGYAAQNAPLPARSVNQPFLLMAGLSEAQQTKLLTNLNAAEVHIPLKAVLTRTNQDWTLSRLLIEISREHALLNRSGGSTLPGLHIPVKGADK